MWISAALVMAFVALVDGSAMPRKANLLSSEDAQIIPGKYIVILKQDAEVGIQGTAGTRAGHLAWLQEELRAFPNSHLEHEFDITDDFTGYTGEFEEGLLEKIRRSELVDYVEMDQVMTVNRQSASQEVLAQFYQSYHKTDATRQASPFLRATAKPTVQKDAPWGISRIASRAMPKSYGSYAYPETAGGDVDVYVVDTGINVDHVDFEGRAKWGKTVPIFDRDIDGNGHGTHCAGTIAGKTYGVAKKANVIAVKVLRTSGFGSNADVIKGIEWVAQQHTYANRKSKKRSAANMSLGGGRSKTLERALDAAVASGVHFAVAAGNDNKDACNYSPAGADSPLTVGASDSSDKIAYFSNHGKCVDIFAPGVKILSTWIGSETATNTISGTSMASPHIAGVLALYLGEADYTPKALKQKIIADATEDVITGLPKNTVNKLAYTGTLIKED